MPGDGDSMMVCYRLEVIHQWYLSLQTYLLSSFDPGIKWPGEQILQYPYYVSREILMSIKLSRSMYYYNTQTMYWGIHAKWELTIVQIIKVYLDLQSIDGV